MGSSKTAQAVIGAWYGDEGKGLMTDYFASLDPKNTAIVRYNGGAQAGHTVTDPQGVRHVFSHFGSGTLVNCPTYLTKFFVCNPILFVKEFNELREKGFDAPIVYAGTRCPVTTPWDVLLNRMQERLRRLSGGAHGSVGVGVMETLIRTWSGYGLFVEDFRNILTVSNKIWLIKNEWLPKRLEELGYGIPTEIDQCGEDTDKFMSAARRFRSKIVMENGAPKEDHIIFEGAQGLCLDENRIDQFPYTTPSRTGLPNILYLCKEWGIDKLQATYVSRTYVTKHGDGPLPNETTTYKAQANNWGCQTNQPNEWQGSIRFADIEPWDLLRNIRLDLAEAKNSSVEVFPSLAWTHCDVYNEPGYISVRWPLWKYFSYGPTRRDVRNRVLTQPPEVV